jgi:hypothetical protein
VGTVLNDVRVAYAHWLLEGRHYRIEVASLTGDCVTHDQQSLGVVMHGDGAVGIGVIGPQYGAEVTLTLAEAHELGSALLALRPKSGTPAADLGSEQ